MKKAISLILALVLCLSLVACSGGDNSVTENPYEKYAKYDKLFELLEDGDFGSAILYIEDLERTAGNDDNALDTKNPEDSSKQEYEMVEITLDNWSDYFEFAEKYVYTEDAFGGYQIIDIYFVLVNKDNLHIDASLSSVAVECNYIEDVRSLVIDPTSKTYQWGDEGRAAEEKRVVNYMDEISIDDNKWYGLKIDGFRPFDSNTETNGAYSSNFQITKIEGTLYIADTQ